MTPPSAAALTACEIVFSRGNRPVLSGVDLSVAPGEIVALLGANGAGKSTLFRILLGLLKPQSGGVELDGRPLLQFARRQLARHIAYVPQGHATPFPYLVVDVILLGRLPHSGLFAAPKAQDRAVVEEIAALLGLTPLLSRPYTEISGGERQLVLLARALAQGARLLLLDEPLTGLDFGYQIRVLQLLSSLAAKGLGVLFSTHHPEHALRCASRAAVLMNGRIVADGPSTSVITAEMLERLYGVRITAPMDWPFCTSEDQIVAPMQRSGRT